MPELPEVETVVRGLRQPLVGRRVEHVWYEREKVIAMPGAEDFAARIVGQTFQSITRRAKYIVCQMDHDVFGVHLRMTGRLYVAAESPPDDRWVRLRLGLDNGESLHFSDARRFGRVYLAPEVSTFTQGIGPEPLDDDFTAEVFAERLRGRQRQIKALLLDQTVVAGVGNIYADESLFLAQIHPLRRADTLTGDELSRLHAAVRHVLNQGIDHEGASVNWYRKPDGERGDSQEHFNVYDRAGQPCSCCGTAVLKIRVTQRGTHFCPTCQREK
jgi:formamidopyrimidine-DNA glycosylase